MSIVKDVAKTPGVAGAFVGTYGMQAYLIGFQGGTISAFFIASAIFVIFTVVLCYWLGPLKPKPKRRIGPLEQSARNKIEAANLTGRFVGLAEALAVRLGELEVGGFSKYSDPEGYAEIEHRLALLDKVIETAHNERRAEKFANNNDIIQAELLGITVEKPEAITQSDEKMVTQCDRGVQGPDGMQFDPAAAFHASVDEEERMAHELEETRRVLSEIEAKNLDLERKQKILDEINEDLRKLESRPARAMKAVVVHSGVRTIKNVQTQEQVDRRNERINAHQSHDITPYLRTIEPPKFETETIIDGTGRVIYHVRVKK